MSAPEPTTDLRVDLVEALIAAQDDCSDRQLAEMIVATLRALDQPRTITNPPAVVTRVLDRMVSFPAPGGS